MAAITKTYASYEQAVADQSLTEYMREALKRSWPTTDGKHRVEREDVVLAEIELDAGCEQAYGESRVTLVQPVLVDEVVVVFAGFPCWGTANCTVSGSTRGEILRNRPAYMASEPKYGWRLAR